GAVAFVDGNRALGAVERSVRVWDVEKGHQEAVLLGPLYPVMCVEYSPDGQRLAAGSVLSSQGASRGQLCIWHVRSRRDQRLLSITDGEVTGLAFHPAGRQFATVGGNPQQFASPGQLRFWDAATGELLRALTLEQTLRCVDYSPDGKSLAVGTGARVIE